jgi:hypothetical protein
MYPFGTPPAILATEQQEIMPMPAKSKKRAPKASRKKVWVHTFYLLQPFMQFFALMAAVLIFARCSPLAPSTDRAGGAGVQDPVVIGTSEQANAAALEQEIAANMQELNSSQLEVVSQSEIAQIADGAPHADQAISETGVKGLFAHHGLLSLGKSTRKILFLPLSAENQEALFRDNHIRLDLGARLKNQTKDKALELFLKKMKDASKASDLGAAAYLVLPDASMQRANGAFSALSLTLRISLSVPADDRAYLEINREDASLSQDDAALLSAALADQYQLAILLE